MVNWIYNTPPPPPGWYPTLICWDVEEGAFPGALYWDEKRWLNKPEDEWVIIASIAYWPEMCSDKEQAEAIAYANDPDRESATKTS
jgi:hypothetical protein